MTDVRPTANMRRRRFLGTVVASAGASVLAPAPALATIARPETPARRGPRPSFAVSDRAFLGAYTADVANPAPGIGLAGIDRETGLLTIDGYHAGVANPFYLTMHPSGGTLYAVSDVPEGRVHAMRVLPGGRLEALNSQSSGGAGPVYLSVHPSGRYLLTANFDSGSVTVNPIAADGSLKPPVDVVRQIGAGPDRTYQSGPHAHMTVTDPTGERILVPDLGNDYLYVYQFDVHTGQLTPESQVYAGAGAGPRHLVFHPSGRYIYLVDQLASAITIFGYDPRTGALWKMGAVSIVPPGTSPLNAPSAIRLSPDARFVYSPNRGLDDIAILAVEHHGRSLSLVGQQRIGNLPPGAAQPYDLAIDPAGRYLYTANTEAQSVTAFAIDRATGSLAPAGTPVTTPSPTCILLA